MRAQDSDAARTGRPGSDGHQDRARSRGSKRPALIEVKLDECSGAGVAPDLLYMQGGIHATAFFYDSLCPKCAEFNYQKRFQTALLRGKARPDHRRAPENRLSAALMYAGRARE